MDWLKQLFTSPALWSSAVAIAVGICAWVLISKLVRQFLDHAKMKGKGAMNAHFSLNILKYIIILLTIITVLKINGVNVASLVAGLGIVGIVVGFALQDILKDLIMGTNIVWDRFFKLGDVVRYNDTEYVVQYFDIKVTKLRDIGTGDIMTVCNRNISEIVCVSDVLNETVPMPYDVDAERARAVCRKICKEMQKSEAIEWCDFLGTGRFADSQIEYALHVHCKPVNRLRAHTAALDAIQDVFVREGISVPYPQLDVHSV